MRKMMTKEVTKTNVKVAKMEVKDGQPVATPMPDEIMLGNVDLEKAQRAMTKKLGSGVTVFQVVPSTETYELPVEEFLKIATIKKEAEEQVASTTDGEAQENKGAQTVKID
jgi:hypothetical protein